MAFRFVEPFEDVGSGITPSSGAKLFFFDVGTSTPKTTFADFALTVPNSDPVVANSNGIFPDIFLDTDADRTLKDQNDVLIYGPDTVHAPESSIAALVASIVTVLDAGGNFTAADVEAVLAEIASDYMRQNRAETISGTKTFSSANIAMADNEVQRALLKDYAVKHNSVASSSGTLTLDFETGNSFSTTLTENTTIALTNPPATGIYGEATLRITQDGAGGAFTITLPASVDTPGGVAYTMSTANNARDKLTFSTIDFGTIYDLEFSQAYA